MAANSPPPPPPPSRANRSSESALVSDVLGLGVWSEKLVDLVAGSVRWVAEPFQIRRLGAANRTVRHLDMVELAKTRSQVALIEAEGEEALEEAAIARIKKRELRKQANFGSDGRPHS